MRKRAWFWKETDIYIYIYIYTHGAFSRSMLVYYIERKQEPELNHENSDWTGKTRWFYWRNIVSCLIVTIAGTAFAKAKANHRQNWWCDMMWCDMIWYIFILFNTMWWYILYPYYVLYCIISFYIVINKLPEGIQVYDTLYLNLSINVPIYIHMQPIQPIYSLVIPYSYWTWPSRNSEFSNGKWWIFPVRYVSHYQMVTP